MRNIEVCRTSRSLRGRVAAWTAVAATMVLTIVGTASAGPAELSPEVRAMARRLAQSEPIQSCAADAPTMLPGSPMFAAGGAVGGSNPSVVGGPGGLWVQCSLPYTNGKSGGDCEGKHTMQWNVINGGQGQKVTAELLALNTNGQVLKSFIVKQGENVQMNSRLSPSDWKFTTNKGTYDIFAPVAMLKVKVEFNGDTAEAYCTSIPYVDVIKPDGGVVTDSTGGGIDFKAAVPRTDPSQLQLKVDGTNVLPLILAQEPSGCPVNAPCDGTLVAPPISYSNLIIDVAMNIATPASNTISGTIGDLGCGEHFVRVISSANPAFRRTSTACNLDDLNDRGSASVFDIQLEELGGFTGNALVNGLITDQIPTRVQGLICGGTPIIEANVNGKTLDVSAGKVPTTPGSGDVGAVYSVHFDTTLNQTDLQFDFAGSNVNGLNTFAPGSNRLQVAAKEAKNTRAYERLMFAVGNNIKPVGIVANPVISQDVLAAQMVEGLQETIQAKMQNTLTGTETEIKNAFILGLSQEGAQQILDNLCTNPNGDGKTLRDIFADAVSAALDDWPIDHPLSTYDFHPPCSCNSDNIPIYVKEWTVGDSFSCPITFEDGKLTVSMVLPDLTVTLRTDKDQECFANHTNVHAFVKAGLTNIHFDYTLLATDIKNGTTSPGAGFKVGGKAQLDAHSDIDYGVLGDVCDFFIDTFVTILTFGQVDLGPLLEPDLSFQAAIDVTEALTPAQPGAIPITGFQIDSQDNTTYHQQMSGGIDAISDVHITGPNHGAGAGIVVGLKGTFATTAIDPTVEDNPGFEAKEPPLPTMGELKTQGALDALVGLSQDSINMMFQSLGVNGSMKVPNSDAQGCFPLGKTIGDLLPANCNTIDIDPSTPSTAVQIDDVGNALARGYCEAIKGTTPCGNINYLINGAVDTGLTSGERGVCFGASGATCSEVAGFDGVLYLACIAAPNLNLHANQNIMFCAKADIPRMEFPLPTGSESPTSVPTNLQMNDISVSLVLDRGLNGSPNGAVDGTLATLPGCFSGTQTNSDCNVFSACLDVNMKFTMDRVEPSDPLCNGKPGIRAGFNSITPVLRKIGEVCSGGTSPTTDTNVLNNASNQTTVTGPIGNNAGAFAPPICGSGLETPLFTCDDVKILGIDSPTIDPKFREFLAITCDLN